jgi:hypothetical protein
MLAPPQPPPPPLFVRVLIREVFVRRLRVKE